MVAVLPACDRLSGASDSPAFKGIDITVQAGEVICLAQLVYRTDGVVFDINIDLDDRNRLLELGGIPES